MKITIYELLGMIKDDKAPKKIKYREMIYHICYEYGDYESDIEAYRDADIKEHYYLFEGIDMLKCLNDEVEILEEEKKIPEKSNIDFNTKLPVSGCSENEAFMMTCISHLGKTIDSLIDYLKSKGDE